MIRVRIPATSANMGPGFDCLGMALNIYNEIEVEEIEEGLQIEIPDEDRDFIPSDETNLVYKSMKHVFDLVGFQPKGISIRLINGIPVTRGLGSSAACIVGGITAANELAGGPLSLQDIINLAAQMDGHPDNVVPAIVGGMAIACMEEKQVFHVRILPPGSMKFAVMIPDFQLSTAKARKILPETITMKDAVFNISRAALMTASLLTGQSCNLIAATDDRLHQPYRKVLIPHWDEIIEGSKELGAKGVFLSGAGPTIIAILEEDGQSFQKGIKRVTAGFHEKWDIRIADLCEDGASLLQDSKISQSI